MEIDVQVVRYELRLPSRDDYRGAIVAVVESLRANRRAAVTLARRDR